MVDLLAGQTIVVGWLQDQKKSVGGKVIGKGMIVVQERILAALEILHQKSYS